MKNKGRKQLAGNGSFKGIANCKSLSVALTRPVKQMGSRNYKPRVEGVEPTGERSKFGLSSKGYSKRFDKKLWMKRVRGYFKTGKWKSMMEEDTCL